MMTCAAPYVAAWGVHQKWHAIMQPVHASHTDYMCFAIAVAAAAYDHPSGVAPGWRCMQAGMSLQRAAQQRAGG